jgi:hypothetical protein
MTWCQKSTEFNKWNLISDRLLLKNPQNIPSALPSTTWKWFHLIKCINRVLSKGQKRFYRKRSKLYKDFNLDPYEKGANRVGEKCIQKKQTRSWRNVFDRMWALSSLRRTHWIKIGFRVCWHERRVKIFSFPWKRRPWIIAKNDKKDQFEHEGIFIWGKQFMRLRCPRQQAKSRMQPTCLEEILISTWRSR